MARGPEEPVNCFGLQNAGVLGLHFLDLFPNVIGRSVFFSEFTREARVFVNQLVLLGDAVFPRIPRWRV